MPKNAAPQGRRAVRPENLLPSPYLRWVESASVRRYLTLMNTRVSTKGQIVLPAAVRLQDDIKPGQEFEVERIDRGEYRLRRCQPSPNQGLADWLLSCPEKGFFVGVASESTDDL
jgi:AbrB family looped-hinge helix DNA binding protein